jgi:hypothetical protein
MSTKYLCQAEDDKPQEIEATTFRLAARWYMEELLSVNPSWCRNDEIMVTVTRQDTGEVRKLKALVAVLVEIE